MKEEKLEDRIEAYNFVLAQRITWMEKIREKIQIEQDLHIDKQKNNKKRIAIIYDVDGWAYHNIAKQIKENLSKYYEIDIFPKEVFTHNVVRLMFLAKKYDLVHLLWRGMFSELEGEVIVEYIKSLGIGYEEFINKFVSSSNITTSVYDHSFLNKESFWITEAFLKYSQAYTVSSQKLLDIYMQRGDIEKKPSMKITDGVDLEKFKPENLERFSNVSNRMINIGWVGNSKFQDSENDDDLKGIRKIINPAIEELKKEGYSIQKKFADRNETYIPHDKMPEYYQSIDIYICASKEEGTPNPVLEAMASGVPIISTNVGIVEEAFGEQQRKYILEERSKQKLKEKIVQLIENQEEWEKLSQENLKQIQDWSWKEKCNEFKDFFDQSIKTFEENKKR